MPKPLWIRGLLGMNQRQAMDEIPDNSSPFLLNISSDKPGSWGKRKGSVILGTALSSSDSSKPTKALVNYSKLDGTNILRKINNGDLYTYDTGTDAWSISINSLSNTSDEIATANYKDRVYYTGANTNLQYESGTGVATTVGSGGNEIKGQFLAVAQQTLYIGATTSHQNRVYYSLFKLPNDSDTANANQPSDQFYENQETIAAGNVNGTLANSSRYFEVNGPIRAMLSYEAINNVVVFTRNKCYSYDLSYASNALGPKTLFRMGCAGKKAFTICNDWLVFMDSFGTIKAYGGAGKPAPVSWEIEDDEYKEAVINAIDKETLSAVAAGSIGNKFYFSVGDITYRGETFSNVLIKGLVTPDFQTVIWGVDTLPYRVTHFENTVIDGEEVLILGSSNNNAYLYGVGNNDNGTAIDARAYTKFYDFGAAYKTKETDSLFVKYRPQPTAETYLTIKYAIDGDFSYTALSTPDDEGSAVTSSGVIDMSERYSSTKLDDVDYVLMPAESEFRSLSIMFQNNQLNEDFEISQYGFNIATKDLDLRLQ